MVSGINLVGGIKWVRGVTGSGGSGGSGGSWESRESNGSGACLASGGPGGQRISGVRWVRGVKVLGGSGSQGVSNISCTLLTHVGVYIDVNIHTCMYVHTYICVY